MSTIHSRAHARQSGVPRYVAPSSVQSALFCDTGVQTSHDHRRRTHVSLSQRVRDIWRKNAPEVIGWWDGSLPEFVTARRPLEPLDGVPVFGYHLVEHDKFEADLAFLRSNGYATLDTTELVDFLNGRTRIAPRSVMLTFDDGPRNFYDVAFPLLQKYGAKAVAFIAPGLHAEAEIPDVEARPMTWGEIRTIAASGLVEFQSHTFESRYVPNWPCRPRSPAATRRSKTRGVASHVPSMPISSLRAKRSWRMCPAPASSTCVFRST